MRGKFAFLLTCWAGSVAAQEPLSAIEWLNDPVPVIGAIGPKATPKPKPRPSTLAESPVASGVSVPDVTVTTIGEETGRETVGLLPMAVTGLPETLWTASAADDVAARIGAADFRAVPALQELFYTLLLAEARPPEGADAEAFLTVRAARLRDFGVVEPAETLMSLLPLRSAAQFSLWFDLTLLAGLEDKACEALAESRAVAQDYAALSFCAMRGGSWEEASLLLETSQALGLMRKSEARLLEAFLDPELAEEGFELAPPVDLTPLEFRLYESIGTPLPTAGLPLPFAVADLRDIAGWKAQLEAAERLARVSAISPNLLLGLYTARRPAASGGVWERARAVQEVERALEGSDRDVLGAALAKAHDALGGVGLDVAFAQIYAPEVARAALDNEGRALRFELGLLTKAYETTPPANATRKEQFLRQLALGAPEGALDLHNTLAEAIEEGFTTARPSYRVAALMEAGKLGEAVLLAASDVAKGAEGDWTALKTALAALRKMGLEDVSRRAALQLMLRERAGR